MEASASRSRRSGGVERGAAAFVLAAGVLVCSPVGARAEERARAGEPAHAEERARAGEPARAEEREARSIGILILSATGAGISISELYGAARAAIEAETVLDVAPLDLFEAQAAIRGC